MWEDSLESCGNREEVGSRPSHRIFNQSLPSGTVQTHPSSHNTSQTENWLPQWFPVPENRLRLESLSYCQFSNFSEKTVPLNLSQQAHNYVSASVDSGGPEHLSSGTRTGAHQASHQKRRRHPGKGKEKPKERQPKHKRKRSLEEADLEEHVSIQRKKTDVETEQVEDGTEKPKHHKEKNS
ncbi:PREDICTED: lysine-rich coiled-coil protein 1-like [Chinchilla lanigera]|uniref:lysine-rich coiled-coil protein 1-like n=1 Tax=Chinchilla lanigera TaxID=34839 RepID=UPI000696223F|nr:PREDICTED: lysine-rich coiled-coil protein 1-like [Chinchilla lanigera]